MVNNKIILYYQTLIGLDKIYNDKNNYVTHIHLSAFHFGTDEHNNPYLHWRSLRLKRIPVKFIEYNWLLNDKILR